MNVVQFLGELPMIADVEIVVTLLPEVIASNGDQSSSDSLLQRLESAGQCIPLGFAQEKVHVFGHDDVSINAQMVHAADTFESFFEGTSGLRTDE